MEITQKKNGIIISLIFCLSFSFSPKAEAVSPKVKTIGGGLAAIACGVGAFYCYKQNAKLGKMIDKLSDIELDGLNPPVDGKDEKELESLEKKKSWYNIGMWACGIGAGVSGAVAAYGAWEWSAADAPLPIGITTDLITGIMKVTPHSDGSYTVQYTNDDEKIKLTKNDLEKAKKNIRALPSKNMARLISEIMEEEEEDDSEKEKPELKKLLQTTINALHKVKAGKTLSQKEDILIGLFASDYL